MLLYHTLKCSCSREASIELADARVVPNGLLEELKGNHDLNMLLSECNVPGQKTESLCATEGVGTRVFVYKLREYQ